MLSKIKAAVLLGLMWAAVWSVGGAYRSLHRNNTDTLPAELSARFEFSDEAEFFLRDNGGYIAVYEDKRAKTPLTVTAIETSILRDTDRQLLGRGIPVKNAAELLGLLEDLGS